MKTTPLLLLFGLALVACTQHGNEHNDAMLKKVVDTDAEDIDDSSMVEQATRLDSFLEVKNGAKNGVLRGQSQQEKRRLFRARKRGRARGRRSSSHVEMALPKDIQSTIPGKPAFVQHSVSDGKRMKQAHGRRGGELVQTRRVHRLTSNRGGNS